MVGKIEYDIAKISVVDIDRVKPNSWNPKNKNTDEYKKVLKSVRTNGLRIPVVVRSVGDDFEIVDGEQRFTACKDLNYKQVLIYNEGIMSDKKAKELTIWYQVQVPFDDFALSELITNMSNEFTLEDLDLPYELLELKNLVELTDFEWDEFDPNEDDSDGGMATKVVKLAFSEEEYREYNNIIRDFRKGFPEAAENDIVLSLMKKGQVANGDS